MTKPPIKLNKTFYTNTDVIKVAKSLLGKFLVTNFDKNRTVGKIVETEAYRGADDKASHAYPNKLTNRTKVMFEEGGTIYVYLCYGIHHLFNVVTAKKGIPNAVLIRAIEPIENVALMLERRQMEKVKRQLSAGPGVLTKALGISIKHNALNLMDKDSPIWIEHRGVNIEEANIIASPRVGIDYAEECAFWNWRFRIKDSKWTS